MRRMGWFVAVGGAIVVAGAGWTVRAADNPFHGVTISGVSAGATFDGKLDIARFEQPDGKIMAVATLSGRFAGGTGGDLSGLAVSLPTSIESSTCERLQLAIETGTVTAGGRRVELARTKIAVEPAPGSTKLLSHMLCSLAQLHGSAASPNDITNKLNQLLRSYD